MKQPTGKIKYAIPLANILLAMASTHVNAGTMGSEAPGVGKIYAGIFGGAGASTNVNINQYGTAFFFEISGGPLAVNAFGHAEGGTVGLVGGQVGYQWADMSSNLINPSWGLAPAIELEGFYLGKSSFTGHEINNNTTRLPEHDFLVHYPMTSGVFLANAVLNLTPSQTRYHPYIAAGIGGAVLSITHATATQTAPAEPGINHYNSNPNDTAATFAAQGKAGLSFDLTQHISLFAEYRGIYLTNSSYSFGSTAYVGHPATSNWHVTLGSQYYNTGVLGLRCLIA